MRISSAPSSGWTPPRTIRRMGCCTTRYSCAIGTHGATAAARSCSRSRSTMRVCANGTPVNLTAGLDGDVPSKPFGGREDYAFSPDGQQVAFSVRAVPVGEPWSTNFDIYTVAAGGGTGAQSDCRQSGVGRQAGVFARRLDARLLGHGPAGIRIRPLSSGAAQSADRDKRPLTQNWDRSISSFAWSRDGKTLFATTDHLGQRPLWAIDANTGRASAITGAGEVEGFSVGPRKVFYTLSNLANPADLYAVGFSGGKPLPAHASESSRARASASWASTSNSVSPAGTTTTSSATS